MVCAGDGDRADQGVVFGGEGYESCDSPQPIVLQQARHARHCQTCRESATAGSFGSGLLLLAAGTLTSSALW
jgi:hypothetical protein